MANEPVLWKQGPTTASLPTLRDIAAILFRQSRVILVVFAIVLFGVAVSGIWIPAYKAHMKILVRHQRLDAVVTPQANVPAQFNGDEVSEEDLNSEAELLGDEDLLRKVVIETGLDKPDKPHSVSLTGNAEQIRIAKAVRTLSKQLSIEPVRKSNIITVQYQSRDRAMAARVLTALANAYTAKHLELARPSGEFVFFDQQMEHYRKGLLDAQRQLADFTQTHNVVSAQMERDFALQRMSEFNTSADQSQTQAAELEKRIAKLKAQLLSTHPRITTAVRTSENPQLMQQLKATLLNLQIKRTELLTQYQSDYPLVREVNQQIADAHAAISAEEAKPLREETTDQDPNYEWISTELTKAQTELAGLQARESSARSIAGESQQRGRTLDQDDVLQQNLLRQEKTQEDNYLLYQRKSEEARISDALDRRGILNVAIAEPPRVPTLPERSPLAVGMLAFFLAGIVSLSTGCIVDFLDPSFRTPDELAGFLESPVLAALPKGNHPSTV